MHILCTVASDSALSSPQTAMVKSPSSSSSIRKTIQLLAIFSIVPFYNSLHLIIFTPFGNEAESQAVHPGEVEISVQAQTNADDDIPTCMVFLHIPKSGGRSVASFLTAVTDTFNFTKQNTYGEKNVHLQPSDLSVNRTFTLGHFTTRLFDEQPAFRKCFTITVLREPVDRAISPFYYHKHRTGQIEGCLQVASSTNNNNTQFKQKYRGKKICRSNWQYSNDMTRRLAGGSLHGMSWNTRAGSRFTKPIPNASHVHDAKLQLRLFDLICFTHDLSKCADGVLRAFRLSRESQHNDDERIRVSLEHMSPKVDPRWKTINRPDKLEESAMEKFREVNDLDIELYDWAIEKFS